MNTRNILTLTLLAVSLTLSAAIPKEIRLTSRQQTNSISNEIATILFEKGIEEEKAQSLSVSIMNTDEELFSFLVDNYASHCQIDKKSIYEELSKLALQKKSVDFAFLILLR